VLVKGVLLWLCVGGCLADGQFNSEAGANAWGAVHQDLPMVALNNAQ
jgi:hypothetical protein